MKSVDKTLRRIEVMLLLFSYAFDHRLEAKGEFGGTNFIMPVGDISMDPPFA
jgi:hypothetical protein